MSQRFLVVLSLIFSSTPAFAQTLGTFRWQLQPYCNVVTLAVAQSGGTYRLEGTDDQCGASESASAIGTAFPNPDGSIGLGLTIVSAPGATPAHVDARLRASDLGGTWRDSAGNIGTLAFTPGPATAGSPRPLGGAIGAVAVDPTQIQLRVGGSCAAGSAMVGVNPDGSVACRPSGGITGISTGPGITGGGSAGNLSLQLDLVELARQLHLREDAPRGNLAVGDAALRAATTAESNIAVGRFALRNTTVGNNNTAVGNSALSDNVDGFANTAVGFNALTRTKGYGNTALGYYAGYSNDSGGYNVYIASNGEEAESNTTRIGGASQTRTFLAGVRAVTTGVPNAVPVVVDGAGQLGTISSSIRGKEQVADLGEVAMRLQALRPVQFQYRTPFADGSKPVQYGLIAEEVATVLPELVAYGADGEPETVMYHVLPTLIVAEVQRLQRELAALRERLEQTEVTRR